MTEPPNPRLPRTSISRLFRDGKLTFDAMVPSSNALVLCAIERAKALAPTDSPALVLGDTGTGKEFMIQAIINASGRKDAPARGYSFAGKEGDVVMVELFGSKGRRFTHVAKSTGLFEELDGGTLVFSDIDVCDLKVQAVLLRFFDGGWIRPQGGKEIRVNVRVIASTNRPLAWFQDPKNFRADLLFRLGAERLYLPPLREREGDIEPLFRYCLEAAARDGGCPVPPCDTGVVSCLKRYSFPGNIRELRMMTTAAVRHMRGPTLTVADLEAEFFTGPEVVKVQKEDPPDHPPGQTLAAVEAWAIRRSIHWHGGNITKTAEALDITRATLYAKLKQYGIER